MTRCRVLAVLALLVLTIAPGVAAAEPPRGIAFLSSAVGKEVPIEEIEDVVRECRIDFVVIDFAWVTYHFGATDLGSVEDLAGRLGKKGITVAAMYRPRALGARGVEAHFARDGNGHLAKSHNHLCFAHEDSVAWGSSWGTRILAACPSIRRMILYNVLTLCRCEKCADGRGAAHGVEFLKACRREWTKTRKDVLVGHVGTGAAYADQVDFLLPFLCVNGHPVPKLLAELETGMAAMKGKPVVPLAKICWGDDTRNTTDDVTAVIRGAGKTGFCLWYYSWIFHPDEDRYDPKAVVKALGGDWETLAPYFEDKPSTLDPQSWVFFDGRRTSTHPRLVLHRKGKKEEALPPEADTILISYLADRSWGHMPSLSISMGDTNRVLLRFPWVREKKIERAELVLTLHLSKNPPSGPFKMAIHRVEEPWTEAGTTWTSQPQFAAKPLATTTVHPKEGEVRIDVTKHFRDWEHGVLLKVANVAPPKPQNAPPPPPDPALIGRALALYPFAKTIPDAVAKSAETGRPVLTIATAGWPGIKVTPQEEILFSTVLSHPAVVRLVNERFVPVRYMGNSATYLLGPGGRGRADPFAPLGTTLTDARAPALIVSTGKGKHVATLPSLGTYDYGLVLDFLRGALTSTGLDAGKEEKTPAGVALMRAGKLDRALAKLDGNPKRTGEETYWLAAMLSAKGEEERADELLRDLATDRPKDPFALKAELRLAFPLRVGEGEPLTAPRRADREKDLVRGGVDYLLDHQRPDGSFPVASRGADSYRPGVTVLAAHALLLWSDHLDAKRKRRVRGALDRANAWIAKNVAKADDRTLNTFAAAYWADYVLERHERKQATKKEAQAAVDKLVAGVCANGAWAYDKRFGDGWKGGFGGWPVTTKGRTHSCNTGPALTALARAQRAGLTVKGSVIERGVKALESMRVRTGVYTYTWPEPRNFEREDASIARAPVCELALFRLGATTKTDLEKTLALFMKHRAGLRRSVKLTAGWTPPNNLSSYFYFFAYYHAAVALADLDARRDLARVREDILAAVEPDGAWVDYEAIGKSYGTAMALLVLRVCGAD